MRTFAFFPLAAFLALVVPHMSAAQAASFEVSQYGHKVGTASFNFKTEKTGLDSTSVVHVSMNGLSYALSKTEQLSAAQAIEHVQLNATVNGSAVSVSAAPDAAQLLLNISANGRSSTARLAAHPSAVFLPDFDPGALQTLLTVGLSRNSRDLWAVLPKQKGSQPASVEPVQLATYADEQGTFDGKHLAVHHLVATIAGTQTNLFAGPDNQLLQAELPQEGFALVRKGFVLTPPAKAPAPAPEPAQSQPGAQPSAN